MKRAHQLQPLSRQHHLGLNLSHHAKACTDESEDSDEHWRKLTSYMDNMSTHFQIEERLIAHALQRYQETIPEVTAALATLHEHHALLHKLTRETQTSEDNAITAAQVRALGTLLYNHIRFEERELFPLAETYLTQAELESIYTASPDALKRLNDKDSTHTDKR